MTTREGIITAVNGAQSFASKHARGDQLLVSAALIYFLDKVVDRLDTLIDLMHQVLILAVK